MNNQAIRWISLALAENFFRLFGSPPQRIKTSPPLHVKTYVIRRETADKSPNGDGERHKESNGERPQICPERGRCTPNPTPNSNKKNNEPRWAELRLGPADPGALELADLELEADAIGPHCCVLVRTERALKDAAVRYVAVCICGWVTLPHNSEELARRKFKLHRAAPWSAFGF